jgi:predicted nucleotidyltransferase
VTKLDERSPEPVEGEIAEPIQIVPLLTRLRAHLPELAARYHIAALGVFGSYLRGEQRPDSDLDLLVEFLEPPTLFDFVRLENELSALVGLPVDLVMKSALKPAIGRYILEEVRQI